MGEKMFNNKTSRYIFIAAAFFYFVSWFSVEDKTLQGIGISLPWVSVFVSIPVSLFMKDSKRNAEKDTESIALGYVYAVTTVAFSIVVLIMTHSVIPVIPHLACYFCLVAAVNIEDSVKEFGNYKKNVQKDADFLETKLEAIDRSILILYDSKDEKYRERLIKIIFDQIKEGYRTLDKYSD